MRIHVLGCGGSGGVPMIGGADGRGAWGACDPTEPRNRRTRTSIVVESKGRRLLVDTGPDLREQLLVCAIPQIDGLIYTHAHADHVLGLDDVRSLNRILDAPLPTAATAETWEILRRRFDYVFRPWQPPGFFRPVLDAQVAVPGEIVDLAGLSVRVFTQDHGFSHSLGLRVGGFGYSTDVVRLDDTAWEILAGVDTWMVGCFQRAPHRTHARLDEVLEWIAKLRPRRTILTHLGPDMDWAWLRANLPPGVEAAHDGMVVEVTK